MTLIVKRTYVVIETRSKIFAARFPWSHLGFHWQLIVNTPKRTAQVTSLLHYRGQ